MSLETALFLVFMSLLSIVGVRGFLQQHKKDQELNRAVDEMNKRKAAGKAAAEESRRVEEQKYRALKKYLFDELKAVSRGEQMRLTSKAVEAAKKKLLYCAGVNEPDALIADLAAERVRDANAIHKRLDQVLFPDALEDFENDNEIQQLFREHLEHPDKKLDPRITEGFRKMREREQRQRQYELNDD